MDVSFKSSRTRSTFAILHKVNSAHRRVCLLSAMKSKLLDQPASAKILILTMILVTMFFCQIKEVTRRKIILQASITGH